ncbi:MAG: hypothetical protein CMI56_00200 [Parcubacteria group bacterium]|nr:hypothetical protein [Parcubacteria group bacterium]|tara:strand:- start:217 stop:2127 length:1911 start_codon:yes stop_codon:yes gene_type:complete
MSPLRLLLLIVVAAAGSAHWCHILIPDYTHALYYLLATQGLVAVVAFVGLTKENGKMVLGTGISAPNFVGKKCGVPPPRLILGPSPPRTLEIFRKVGIQAGNPFINRTAVLSISQRIAMAMGAAFLLPWRIPLALFGCISMVVFARLSAVGLSEQKLEDSPLPFWRTPFRYLAYRSFRIILFAVGVWRITETGKKAKREEASIIVANHSSMVDMVVGYLYNACGVSKIENSRVPLFGKALRALQTIMVDRGSQQSREETKKCLIRRARETSWPQTLIFPEGTCSNRSTLCTFKAGPFIPGVPVQPVAIRYTSTDTLDLSLVRGGPQLGSLLFRMMCTLNNGVSVKYLPVYTPSKSEIKDATKFAENVRTLIAVELGVSLAGFCFADVLFMITARKRLSLPCTRVVVEYDSVRKVFPKVTSKLALKILDRFALINTGRTGILSQQELCFTLRGSALLESEVNRLYTLMDEHGNREVCFRQFLIIGLLFLSIESDASLSSASLVCEVEKVVLGVFSLRGSSDPKIDAILARCNIQASEKVTPPIAIARYMSAYIFGDLKFDTYKIDAPETKDAKENARALLKSIGLENYESVLFKNGFDSIESMRAAKEEDFSLIGLKLGHRRLLQTSVEKTMYISKD